MSSERWSVPRRWNPALLALLAVIFTASCSHQGEAPRRHAAHVVPGALVEEKSIVDLQAELVAGRVSSVQLVEAYFARIDALDDAGPEVNAVLARNPHALRDAAALDAERALLGARGPLHGIPILIKDNIETADPMPTTAGSLALEHNLSLRDAPIVARLRAQGAVILGKTNLSEWANIRSNKSISGWSAVGGLTRNPYSLDRSACGSSAGSGAAVAASLAAAALGTDTSGSIICPATVNGVVGLKPTVGLLSRRHIVPISRSQDSPGPLGRTVADVAVMLTATAGSDPADPATAQADAHTHDYVAGLRLDALEGKRLGVLRFLLDNDADVDAEFDEACDVLEDAGAELVDIDEGPELDTLRGYQDTIVLTELKADLNTYLAGTPPAVKSRTLGELIAFNQRHAEAEMRHFDQELFHLAEGTFGLDNPRYLEVQAAARRGAGPEGIDALLARYRVDALIGPTAGQAWVLDSKQGAGSFNLYAMLAAVAGYPQLTVPMGDVGGLPVGVSFIGTAWSEADLLAYGYAFEQRAEARLPPTYVAVIGERPRRLQRLKRRLLGAEGAIAGLVTLALGAALVVHRRRRRRTPALA
jgi:amidase